MSVVVYYSNCGSRRHSLNILESLIREVKGPDYSRILYIAPKQKILDARARTFAELAGKSYIPPEFVTIRQLSKRLYSVHGEKTILSPVLLPLLISSISGQAVGLSSIISKFYGDIMEAFPDSSFDEIGLRLNSIMYELGLPDVISKRIAGAVDMLNGLETKLSEKGFITEEKAIIQMPRIIKERMDKDCVILDGFYELTNVEKNVILSLIDKSKKTIFIVPVIEGFQDITGGLIDFIKNECSIEEVFINPEKISLDKFYHPYASLEEEVEGIARNIKGLFLLGRCVNLDKVVVSFPNLHQYSESVSRVFTRYGIPFVVSGYKPVSRERPFIDILCLLESVAGDYPRLPFMSFLSSPFFKGIREEIKKAVRKMSLNAGIIKGRNNWLRAFKKESADASPHFHRLIKRLDSLSALKTGSYAEYLGILNEILKYLEFSAPGAVEDVSHLDIKDMTSIVGSIDIIDGNKINLRGFIDAISHVFESAFSEAEGSGVRVMSLKDAMGLEPDYVYIGGLKDGDIPSLPDTDYLLPDSLRSRLGFRNLKRHLLLEEFVFRNVRESAREVFLSHPSMEDDKVFLPSMFLSEAIEKKERIAGVFSKSELLTLKEGVRFSKHIKEIEKEKSVSKKYDKDSRIRVTDIDYYRFCPRKFFIEKILGLEPAELSEYKLEAITIGTIAHLVMEKLMMSPSKNQDEFTRVAISSLDEALKEQDIEPYWKGFIKGSFLEMIPFMYSIEESIRQDGFRFLSAERPVEGEPLKGIKLKGKIDRIDENSERVCSLIDYKTGSARLSATEILDKGATLQLFLYASILKQMRVNVERVGIYSLKDLELKWIPNKKDIKAGRTLDEYIISSLKYLEETVAELRKGDFKALPIDEGGICRRCHERPYCPYIQGKED